MGRLEILEKEWLSCYKRLAQSEFFTLLNTDRLQIGHYVSFLRESYYNVAHNTKKMALFQANMETDLAALEAKFLKHAAMEVGHDKLVLDDLRVLGVDTEAVRKGRPLPTTEALTGFIVFQIEHRNPYAYLGYLYHLEALPSHMGANAGQSLLRVGVPENAMTFLAEHTEADSVHVKWNHEYINGFPRTEDDFEAVLYGLRGACELHGVMFQGILDHAFASDRKEVFAA